MVKVNGEEANIVGKTISEYLRSAEYGTQRVAVEINGEIVPRAKFDSVTFSDGDVVEVVRFVGGG